MKHEESFGIIPLRRAHGQWEVFVIQHVRGHYWGFPKGHAEASESAFETAVRELKEETNLSIQSVLKKEPFIEQYQFIVRGEKVSKTVSYFSAEVGGEIVLQSVEIQNGEWLPFDQAVEKVTHLEGKTILAQVKEILP